MTTKTSTNDQLVEQLAFLKLSFMLEQFSALAGEAARAHWNHVAYLAALAEGETTLRRERSVQRRIKLARFPVIKTQEQFQWSWPKAINRQQVQHLFRLDWVAEKGNVVFLGTVGVGKTHLATALRFKACLKGYNVRFATTIEVVNTLVAGQFIVAQIDHRHAGATGGGQEFNPPHVAKATGLSRGNPALLELH